MFIAPGFKTTCWRKLKLDDPAHGDWSTAIEILDARIRGRYIDPADELLATDQKILPAVNRRFGFTVLAIDCLMIETLQSFIEGWKSSHGKSTESFRRFLTTRKRFKKFFTKKRAERFYSEFRCGILHQAEIQGNSFVWSVGDLLEIDGKKMTVNRTKFHKSLKDEFVDYLDELRDSVSVVPRKNFRKKMDHICRH